MTVFIVLDHLGHYVTTCNRQRPAEVLATAIGGRIRRSLRTRGLGQLHLDQKVKVAA